MLRERFRQFSLADADQWYEKIPKNSFWHRMRSWLNENLRDEQFADMYADKGRPAIPPTFMVGLILIQIRQGWSDAEVIEAAMFDDRVKYALGLSRTPEITCDRTTLCKFRARALKHDLDRKMLTQTLRTAADAGLLGDDEDLVDSFMVHGAAAKQGTFVLIHQAIAALLRQMQLEKVQAPELRRSDYGSRRKPDIDWADEQARLDLLQDLVADARDLVAYCREVSAVSEELKQKRELLETVSEQDIQVETDSSVTIAQKVAPDRVISVVDDQMRHGRKTTSAKTDGYKTHVLTQNVPSSEARLVTAVVVTPANTADGEVLPDLLKERMELTGHAPKQVMGDSAYGAEAVQQAVSVVSADTQVVAPVPPSSNRKGLFSKADFQIDTEAHTVTCPAGHTVSYEPKRRRQNTKSDQVVKMDEQLCKTCPLREQCVGGKGPRTIRVRRDEKAIQEKRTVQSTPEWKEHSRERSRVEHVNESMARHGGRQGRYFGTRKTAFQERFCASVHNIVETERVKSAKNLSPDPWEKCA